MVTTSVAGTVVDDEKRPIPSAHVYLSPHPESGDTRVDRIYDRLYGTLQEDFIRRAQSHAARTDKQGRYVFRQLACTGPATISAYAAAFETVRRGIDVRAGIEQTGIDLVLHKGKLLRGQVVGLDGSPVTDALVSVWVTWKPGDIVSGGAGPVPTDGDGRFFIGLPLSGTTCNLRVNSDTHGQDFFLEVPITGDEFLLQLRETATLRGHISWSNGTLAEGLVVFISTEVPDPPCGVTRSGLRPRMPHEAVVGADGLYEIEGLLPGFSYCPPVVIDGDVDRLTALKTPLSRKADGGQGLEGLLSRRVNRQQRLVFAPGEVKEWNCELYAPSSVRGQVRTVTSNEPVPSARVAVWKNGTVVGELFCNTKQDGSFQCHINTGPGEYLLHAYPAFSDGKGFERIAEEFGKALHLQGGEDVTVDLYTYKPTVIPIRIVDGDGLPVKEHELRLQVKNLDGRQMSHGLWTPGDEEGRVSVSLYFPFSEIWIDVMKTRKGVWNGGPQVSLTFDKVADTIDLGLLKSVEDMMHAPYTKGAMETHVVDERFTPPLVVKYRAGRSHGNIGTSRQPLPEPRVKTDLTASRKAAVTFLSTAKEGKNEEVTRLLQAQSEATGQIEHLRRIAATGTLKLKAVHLIGPRALATTYDVPQSGHSGPGGPCSCALPDKAIRGSWTALIRRLTHQSQRE